jgi:hypothetical protein
MKKNMPSNPKKRASSQNAKIRKFPTWFRHIVSYLYGVSLFSIGAAVVLLLVLAVTGDLFSKNGLFLMLYLLVFLTLLYLKKQFDKDD